MQIPFLCKDLPVNCLSQNFGFLVGVRTIFQHCTEKSNCALGAKEAPAQLLWQNSGDSKAEGTEGRVFPAELDSRGDKYRK